MRMTVGNHVRFCGYFDAAFDVSTDDLVNAAREELRGVRFDTMVGTGLSGSLVVPVLARAFGKHFAIVRKDVFSSHSSNRIEGRIGKRWLFVDDFMSTGATYRKVREAIKDCVSPEWARTQWPTRSAGCYLYRGDCDRATYQRPSEVNARLRRLREFGG